MSEIGQTLSDSSSLNENELTLLELAEFVGGGPGFRLGLATYDAPEMRDTVIRRLSEQVLGQQVYPTKLDIAHARQNDSLLQIVREHLHSNPAPLGKYSAVMVVGLESAIDFRRAPDGLIARGGPLLNNANLQRDSFPGVCPFPIVLWLSSIASTTLAQSAPDLWHWRSASFTFTGGPDDRLRLEERLIRSSFTELSALPEHRKNQRISLLKDLIAELEAAADRDTPGNMARRAHLLRELGLTYMQLPDLSAGIENFSGALGLARALGDRQLEQTALAELGTAYLRSGRLDLAIESLEMAQQIAHEIGDLRGEWSTLADLGLAFETLGERVRAIGYFEQALMVAREIGDRRGESYALGNLGVAYGRLGQAQRAIEYFEQSLDIARKLADRPDEGNMLGNLGVAYKVLGMVEEAIRYYEEALAVDREIGDRRGEANVLGNLGLTLAELGQVDRAMRYFEQAIRFGQEVKDPRIVEIWSENLQRFRNRRESEAVE